MNYTFKTIVAPEAVRADFTVLRDELESSDKQLMQALWNLGTANREKLEKEIRRLKAEANLAREAKKAAKNGEAVEPVAVAAKPKKNAANAKAPAKRSRTRTHVVKSEDPTDDVETTVVDGTL